MVPAMNFTSMSTQSSGKHLQHQTLGLPRRDQGDQSKRLTPLACSPLKLLREWASQSGLRESDEPGADRCKVVSLLSGGPTVLPLVARIEASAI